MSQVALSGNDTIIINGRKLNDLAVNDIALLTYPNEIMTVVTGKNGNSIYSINESGRQADFELNLIRASPDDKFLNGLFNLMLLNPAGFVLLSGEFVKRIGDGNANIASDTYILQGGVFVKGPEAKSNVSADTEQSVSKWMMKFSKSPRALT
jgi:hypothetical protein